MSCRVLSRGLEKKCMQEIIEVCKKRKIKKIIGMYIKTEKNSLVKDHYDKLNFKIVDEKKDFKNYELNLSKIKNKYKSFINKI